MAEIIELFRNASFDPETVKAMSEAYELACGSLYDTGQPALVRDVIAQRIIKSAEAGERDPKVLAMDALKAFGPKAVLRDKRKQA